jgi:hypothetical protein
MADPIDDELTKAYQDQLLEAELTKAYQDQVGGGPQHGMWEGMGHQALNAATLNASKYFKDEETLKRDERFAREHPWASTGAQAAGFVAPMLTPAGWITRGAAALPRVAKVLSWALPFSNFNKAVAPGATLRTIAHQSGVGSLKAGAMMRFNDPVKTPTEINPVFGGDPIPINPDDPIETGAANLYTRASRANPFSVAGAMDYGLGAAGGYAGNKIGSAIGSATQKLVDQVPRFSWNRGRTGDGFYDWTRGGAQRAHDAISGDLQPGQSIEQAATHGMLGDFRMLQPSSRTRTGYSHAPAPHEYKYAIAERYVQAIESGLSPTAARAQVASDILADPQIIARFNLRGRGRAPAPSTIQSHVKKVADAMDEARQFPTTLQERVALSQGGTSASGKPTYGAAPNSFAAVDEMLTSPGSKDPGSARAQATNWIGQRQQTQLDRVKNFLDENLGDGDVHNALAAHEARRAAAYDTYDPSIAAWKADPNAPDALEHAVSGAIRKWRTDPRNNPAMTVVQDVDSAIREAFERKVQRIADDVEVPTQNIGRDGKPITRIETGPTPPAEIRVPNQLEAFIAQRSNFARKAEAIKLSDPVLYRAMKGFQKDHLDPAVMPLAPDWAASNRLAADTHAMRRAFTTGETFPMGATTKQAEGLKAYRRMSPDQQAMFRSGVAAQIMKRLSGKGGDPHVYFSKPEVANTLRLIMGDGPANQLLRELQAVAVASKTNRIFGQSATHGREAEERANRSILNLIQSIGNFAMSPIHGLGSVAKWGAEKMATEAQRARNDRALRILTANTDDLPSYFRNIRDVTDSRRNHLPAVTQRIDDLLRQVGTVGGVAGTRRDERMN